MPRRIARAVAPLALFLTAAAAAPSFAGEPASADGPGIAAERRDVAQKLAGKSERLVARPQKRFDEPDGAQAFFMQQRLAPGMDRYPMELVEFARANVEAREARLDDRVGVAGVSGWQEIGPGNVGGRTRTLVINPQDPDIMYAGGVAGGVWKSTDAGASWTALDDSMLNLAVCSLAMDPANPDVLYAGTGEGFFNGDRVRGLGVFKTVDAGATWTQLPATVGGTYPEGFYYVNDIVISPNDSNRVYAATWYGVFRSLDAGVSWELVLSNSNYASTANDSDFFSFAGATDLAIRPDGPNDTVFVALGSFTQDGLYRSTNNGAGGSWTRLGTPSDLDRSDQGRMVIALAPSDPDIVYVSMCNNGASDLTGATIDIFRSLDGGATWAPRLDNSTVPWSDINPNLHSNLIFSNGCAGSSRPTQGWYDAALAVDPTDPDVVWVGGIDAFRSTDGGQRFEIASYWYLSKSDAEYVHADHHYMVFHPDYDGVTNTSFFITTDGGVFRTDNPMGTTSTDGCPATFDDLADVFWTSLNNGYGVTQFYHGDSSATTDVFGGGTQDNGTILVSSRATPDSWIDIFGGDGGYFAIDYTNPLIMYCETQRFPRIRKSTDGGASFFDAVTGITDTDGLFITPFIMDPTDPTVLWTGGTRAWRTTNGAASWELGSANVADPFPGADRISAIAIAPTDSDVVFLGFSSGHVAYSTNALDPTPTWTIADDTDGLPVPAFCSSVAVDPVNPLVAYATYSTFGVDHIFRTIDGGASWASIDGIGLTGVPDVPVHWLSVRPSDPTALYAGTEIGVFASDDGGATWNPANFGFPLTVVETLDFQDDDTIVAFTHGRGAFATDLDLRPDCNGNLIADADEALPILYVDDSATGAGDGSSWADAYTELQHALCVASGDGFGVVTEIRVAEGVYSPDALGGGRDATFQLVSGVEILGGYPDGGAGPRDPATFQSVLDGDINGDASATGSYHVVTGTGADATAVLDGFVIRGGNAVGGTPDYGGGVLVDTSGGSPVIRDTLITQNNARFGGGMLAAGPAASAGVTLERVTFLANTSAADSSGAGAYLFGADFVMTECRFESNAGGFGVGFFADTCDVDVSDTDFVGNAAELSGGAANFFASTGSVVRAEMLGNSAGFGGAMFFQGGSTVEVVDSLVAGNSAETAGGGAGVIQLGTAPLFYGVTFADNTVAGAGAALNVVADSTPTVNSCILWGNEVVASASAPINEAPTGAFQGSGGLAPFPGRALPVAEINEASNGVASVLYSIVQGGWPGVNTLDADPAFVDAANGDYTPGVGSAAIDAGDSPSRPASAGPTDLGGSPRPIDATNYADTGVGPAPVVDIGAYEAPAGLEAPVPCPTDLTGDGSTLLEDFAIFAANFGMDVPPGTSGDFDGDGKVLLSDFAIFAADFGCVPTVP